jgi:hypothetical protein
VEVVIHPEPSEDERRAVLAALDGGGGLPPAYSSRWRASALDDLRDDALAQEPGRDARVVEA